MTKANKKKAASASKVALPPLLTITDIQARLQTIFPPEFPNRGILIGRMASRVIYVFIYGGFLEGHERYLRPSNVYFFTIEQSLKNSEEERKAWLEKANSPGFRPEGERWYADTSREPIRDDLMRNRLLPLGVIQKLPGYAITSSSPINSLSANFAALFDPGLNGQVLDEAIDQWRKSHLDQGTLNRMALRAQGVTQKEGDVFIDMPDGTRIRISAGPSSQITKGLIEDFARIHLDNPVVLWLSASDVKTYPQYVQLAAKLGLKFNPQAELPDLILADLTEPIQFVFCEVVASDGPVTDERKKALLSIVRTSKLSEQAVRFLTAFEDREAKEFRKVFSAISPGTAVWFRTEPNLLVLMTVEPEGPVSETQV